MSTEERRRRSRWMMRAQEWDEPRAKYPNVWHEGMPRHVLAFDTVASRLRLGDLIAVYYPASQRHPARSNCFVGLSRVVGLRRAEDPASAWIALETAHRFDPPLRTDQSPRRVFLCCDAGWPEKDAGLFRRVFEAAVAAGWKPSEADAEPAGPAEARRGPPPAALEGAAPPEGPAEAPRRGARVEAPLPEGRVFGGATYSGDMRDAREGTWLALLALEEPDRLRVVRLEATGRSGLHGHLRNPDDLLMRAEAVGLGFPFGLPVTFAEALLGGPFPADGWWALAHRLERMSWPDYLTALQEFREAHGTVSRYTDTIVGLTSAIDRSGPDPGSMAYHGIKMIAEERSRYAIRPFETARGKPVLEVYPDALMSSLGDSPSSRLAALDRLERFPVSMDDALRAKCLRREGALRAVIAGRCAASAVLSGETELSPEQLAADEAERIRREGWVYGHEARVAASGA